MRDQAVLPAVEARHLPHLGCRLNGNREPVRLNGTIQIISEHWNRVVAVPYLAYMPEKDRLLMLVSCDYPHRAFVSWSDDRGASWTEPMPAEKDSNDSAHHVAVGLTYLGGGKVVFSTESTHRYFSDDFGQTWSDPVPKPPITGGKFWNQWDPWLVDKDAKTGKIVRVWETGWNFPGETWRPDGGLGTIVAYWRSSVDEGKNWTPAIEVPEWFGVSEVALCRAANGHLIAACRTAIPEAYNTSIPDVDHYAGLGVSISSDNGQTWSKINSLYAWGRHHPSLVLLPNGEIVMTYVVRKGCPNTADGFPQFGIDAVVSRDHGLTWDMGHRYRLAEWVGNRKGEHAWWASCQATSSVLLPDGTILTAFGTGYRSQPNVYNQPAPRDIGLIYWKR
jgi:hypothetical protein